MGKVLRNKRNEAQTPPHVPRCLLNKAPQYHNNVEFCETQLFNNLSKGFLKNKPRHQTLESYLSIVWVTQPPLALAI